MALSFSDVFPLAGNPLPDVGRAVLELDPLCLAGGEEPHDIAVDEQDPFEIDGQAALLVFEHAAKHVETLRREATTQGQDDPAVRAHESIDPAGHRGVVGVSPLAASPPASRASEGPDRNLLIGNQMATERRLA